jgi:hypothetical protein
VGGAWLVARLQSDRARARAEAEGTRSAIVGGAAAAVRAQVTEERGAMQAGLNEQQASLEARALDDAADGELACVRARPARSAPRMH